ncbi:MAG: hypothetical protein OD816_000301 [Thermodesulfobacterium sp.]|uniref:Uncharacterized protein n=1 Tax=Candidatus Thermodesulfobacterium syntrophicum TaxID=3060442 RepID=A0AAE3P3F3_9BACT|nr:hypothetical protein [Candidatus Thermodesulfobacterium syntrophicum]
MEEEHRYSSVVTSFFYVFEYPTRSTLKLRPGLDLLAGILVRCAAHKIYIPYRMPRFGPSIDEVIKEYPPSLQNRIEIVDREGKYWDRVIKYLKPVYDEIMDSPLVLFYNIIADFFYKLLLASKYNAEADVNQSQFIGNFIQLLKDQIKDTEAKFRLDQLLGIYSNYSNPLKIETFTIFPNISITSIYHRISDFLDEAEIIELSKNRHLLGIPSKAKIALMKMKKGIRHFFSEKKYKKYIGITTELLQIVGTLEGVRIPNIEYFRELYSSEYNPPLVDLDYYRVQICKQVNPGSFPNFILPDGATRALTDKYFLRYWRRDE